MNMAKRCWVHYGAFEYGDEPPSESHVEVPDTNTLQTRLTRLGGLIEMFAQYTDELDNPVLVARDPRLQAITKELDECRKLGSQSQGRKAATKCQIVDG